MVPRLLPCSNLVRAGQGSWAAMPGSAQLWHEVNNQGEGGTERLCRWSREQNRAVSCLGEVLVCAAIGGSRRGPLRRCLARRPRRGYGGGVV